MQVWLCPQMTLKTLKTLRTLTTLLAGKAAYTYTHSVILSATKNPFQNGMFRCAQHDGNRYFSLSVQVRKSDGTYYFDTTSFLLNTCVPLSMVMM